MSEQVQPSQASHGFGWVGIPAKLISMVGDLLLAPFYRVYQGYLETQLAKWNKPHHIGIVMDGNRRFARMQKLNSVLHGHERGADKLEEVLGWCEDADVDVVTVWIFSMDNFKRDPKEVEGLMGLFEKKFKELINSPRVHEHQIRVRTVGKISALPQALQKVIQEAEKATAHYERRVLNIGVAYGGREEIVDAFRRHIQDEAQAGKTLEQIAHDLEPDVINPYLYTSHVADPDLIIRTSGEVRLSGFLLWQSVYSEFYFCDTNWPAFRKIDFLRALRDYDRRQRRFGK